MEIHCLRLRIFLAGFADELINGAHVRMCLHAKFAVESTPDLAVILKWTHISVPDYQ